MLVDESSSQFVHVKVKFPNLTEWVYFTGIYGSPNGMKRKELWPKLDLLARKIHIPRLLAGNFNALPSMDDKQGEARFFNSPYDLFQKFCTSCILKDLGFHEPQFTWSRDSLLERLDQTLCNFEWEVLAPSTVVHHLHKLKSDHRPLAICFGKNFFSKKPALLDFLVIGLHIVSLGS